MRVLLTYTLLGKQASKDLQILKQYYRHCAKMNSSGNLLCLNKDSVQNIKQSGEK